MSKDLRINKVNEVRKFIIESNIEIVKEIPEHEVFIVTSSELGLKNLVIDLEDDQILFKIQLGELKDTFEDVDGTSVSRSDVEKEFMKLGNPFYEGGLKTGQFSLDEVNENMLVFVEQEFLPSLTIESFQNVVNGFSETLVDKIDFIQYAIKIKEEVK